MVKRLYIIIIIIQTPNRSNRFELSNKRKEITKERFDSRSIFGISVAGKTRRLEKMYITLLRFNQDDILRLIRKQIYIHIFSYKLKAWQF